MADSDAVRLTLAEASDVHRMILDHLNPKIDRNEIIEAIENHLGNETLKYGQMADEIVASIEQRTSEMRHYQIEDLVNRIGEVYETALARTIKESVSEVREGMSETR